MKRLNRSLTYKNEPMKKLDLKKVKLPLTNKSFILLRKSIRNRKVRWMDMPNKLMSSYIDYWKSDNYKKIQDTLQD